MSAPFRILCVCLSLPLVLLASGCNQNVACVFTDGCTGGPGAISDNDAVLPVDGDWIRDGPPDVEEVFPSGAQNAGSTPIVVVFSESISTESLLGAIEVVPLTGGGFPGQPIPGLLQQLVSDGRVLVILPPPGADLPAGDYIVRTGEDVLITDLTGQELDRGSLEQLGTFNVTSTPTGEPQLVTTFPADGAGNQSETVELVVVFDRPIQAQSVNPISFDVKVGGVDPPNDPPPTPLRFGSALITDTRAFLYQSVDADGEPVPLGTSQDVELRLSPSTSSLTDADGDELAATTISFTTLAFSAPLGASILSDPNDAIGLANLTDGDLEELTIEVELDGAETNDSVDLFLFGEQKNAQGNGPLIALQRSVRLTDPSPVLTATFLREDVAMQLSDDPDDTRFEDGPLTFAFRLRRGSVITPVRVLDLDPAPDIIQDPLLDTSRPTVEELAGSDETDIFRSDLRGLSLAGQADERLRSVEVETPLANNGSLPAVVGSSEDGFFLAAPVPLDVVAGGTTTFTMAALDEALNTAPTLDGSFFQVGVLGPQAWTAGADIEVEVFDAGTLEPLDGALVLLHSDQGNGTDFPFVVSGLTVDGKVTLTSAGAPSVGAIVTVVRTGYNLFTLHGAPSTHVSVPLPRTAQPPARASGQVTTKDAAANALLPNLDRRFDDSRRLIELPRGFEGDTCSTVEGVLVCTYVGQPVRERRLGARSFYAGDFSQAEAVFSVAQLLQAFAISIPFAPADPGQFQVGSLEVEFLLIDAAAPPEEVAQPIPAFDLHVDPAGGVDFAKLFDDPDTEGVPFVSVEALVPGLPGALGVGAGLAYDRGSEVWTVRSAMPGAITAAGSLGSVGSVDTDPFVRAELRDLDGNISAVRPRFSTLQAAGSTLQLEALRVPAQISPAADSETGTQAFTLFLTHAIDDTRPEPGLYRVELNDAVGRAWTLWRFDPSGTQDVQVRVVDVGDAGSVGLADGAIASTVSAFAWAGLVPTDFLWTDVEREFELFSRAETVDFFKPLRPPLPRR